MIKIDKDIPIPEVKSGRIKGVSKYPFKNMDINDSFFIENRSLNKARPTIYRAAKTAGVKASVRPEGTGIRVWRVE